MENCTALGLNGGNIVYVGYASSSAGANFSLGTPTSSSTYVGFISLPSTASTPSVNSFAGTWVALSSSSVLQSAFIDETTTSTTLTTLNTLTLPVGVWGVGDVIQTKHSLTSGLIPSSKAVTLLFMGANPLGVLPNFNYTGAATTINGMIISCEITKTNYTEAVAVCSVKYIDNTNEVLHENAYENIITITNTDSLPSTVVVKGQCSDGSEIISLNTATVLRLKA